MGGIRVATAFALCLVLTGSAWAQGDCRDALKPDIVSLGLDDKTSLAFLWIASDDEFEERKRSGNGFLGLGDLEATFGNEKSQTVRRQKLRELGYSFDQDTSIRYYATRVSD